jgi:hypothetical protein
VVPPVVHARNRRNRVFAESGQIRGTPHRAPQQVQGRFQAWVRT